MLSQLKVPVAVFASLLISACTSVSPTEQDFRNSVENMIAKQQIKPTGPLQADEPIQSGDGRRLENVLTVYQTHVGDPTPVVREVKVEGGEG